MDYIYVLTLVDATAKTTHETNHIDVVEEAIRGFLDYNTHEDCRNVTITLSAHGETVRGRLDVASDGYTMDTFLRKLALLDRASKQHGEANDNAN